MHYLPTLTFVAATGLSVVLVPQFSLAAEFQAITLRTVFDVSPTQRNHPLRDVEFIVVAAPFNSKITDLQCPASNEKGISECWFVGECTTTSVRPREYVMEAGRITSSEGERRFRVTIEGCSSKPKDHTIRYQHVHYSELRDSLGRIIQYERQPGFDGLLKGSSETGMALAGLPAGGTKLPNEWDDAVKTYRDLSSIYLAASRVTGLSPESAQALKGEADGYQARLVMMANAQIKLIVGNFSADIAQKIKISGSFNDWRQNLQQVEQSVPTADDALSPAQRREIDQRFKQLQVGNLDNAGFKQLDALSKLGKIK